MLPSPLATWWYPRSPSLLEHSCISLEMVGPRQYSHSNGSPLTNPLEVRATSLLTAFSQGVEETPSGGATASIGLPSLAEVCGSAQSCHEAICHEFTGSQSVLFAGTSVPLPTHTKVVSHTSTCASSRRPDGVSTYPARTRDSCAQKVA